jgi:hypothetical protein
VILHFLGGLRVLRGAITFLQWSHPLVNEFHPFPVMLKYLHESIFTPIRILKWKPCKFDCGDGENGHVTCVHENRPD